MNLAGSYGSLWITWNVLRHIEYTLGLVYLLFYLAVL